MWLCLTNLNLWLIQIWLRMNNVRTTYCSCHWFFSNDATIRRAGWFSLICGLSQDKWSSKMGTYHWEGHQDAPGLFNAYLQGSESSALLRGMCPSPGFEKKWDRHIEKLRGFSYKPLNYGKWAVFKASIKAERKWFLPVNIHQILNCLRGLYRQHWLKGLRSAYVRLS